MEGRARARPNNRPCRRAVDTMPPSMEGRARARPNHRHAAELVGQERPSMEGRARARPNLAESTMRFMSASLQWRAGHVPGQTRSRHRRRHRTTTPSMEGRARARPNGDGVDPVVADRRPSMEGRARARPNAVPLITAAATIPLQWRAGHVPGQTGREARDDLGVGVLQWRAGHVPGQTRSARARSALAAQPFNGGPGTCPAKRHRPVPRRDAHTVLQWRAGHVPGQTGRRPQHARRPPSMEGRARARPNAPAGPAWPSMEGRARARPNCGGLRRRLRPGTPSMEGRARARPNPRQSGCHRR